MEITRAQQERAAVRERGEIANYVGVVTFLASLWAGYNFSGPQSPLKQPAALVACSMYIGGVVGRIAFIAMNRLKGNYTVSWIPTFGKKVRVE